MATSKPLEKIYINLQIIDTEQDGEAYILLALDDYSEYLFPPVVGGLNEDLEQRVDHLIKCYNSTRENFNPNIHAKQTAYYTNLPDDFFTLFKAFIRPPDSIKQDSLLVEKAFKHVMETFFKK